MPRSSSHEIVQGYIEEVKTYLPSLTEGIQSLRENPEQKEILEEVHRLVHTIKGASSMVGIYGLSHIAFQMEDALDDIITGNLDFTEETFNVMSHTIGQFQEYCSHFLESKVNSRDMLKETVLSFRRMRKLPPDEDEAVLQKLLEIVPEQEGEGESDAPSDSDDEALSALLASESEPVESSEIVDEIAAPIEKNDVELPEDIELSNITDTVEDDNSLMALLEGEPKIEPEKVFHKIEERENLLTLEMVPSEEIETDYFSQETESVQLTLLTDLSPELLESFYEEAEEHLQDMGRSLNFLESQIIKTAEISESQREVIRQIRRSVHTLKGAAAIIGLPNISSYAHSVEDLLDWLYETAREISPQIISVLSESAHLLERIVANPQIPQDEKVRLLREEYSKIMGIALSSSEAERLPLKTDIEKEETDEASPENEDLIGTQQNLSVSSSVSEDTKTEAEDNILFSEEITSPSPISLYQTRTLRVGMERVDNLVNLVGELIIALSGFDQKMDMFLNSVRELELSRNRLREIAKEMEISYEVKALERQKKGKSYEDIIWVSGHQIVKEKNGKRGAEFEDFDTLELDRYSELNLIIRTLNESVIDVGAINTGLANLYSEFDGHLNRQRVLLSELQDKMMRVRMTPMQIITNKLRRTVHNVANKLDKKIRLVIEGEDIELDRVVWEKITDPLMHLLRNAADHGIEPPELRQAMGKPLYGTIRLSATREGNQVAIRIEDDGAGLNYQAIRETARKTVLANKVDKMSEEELAGFIFFPGFSTRGKISEVSGRGVGMDVVRKNIQDLKGTVRVASWKEKGTRFTIRIPLTLAVIRALLFTVQGQLFALALNEIKEIVRVEPERITGKINTVVRLDNEVLPLYYLAALLNAGREESKTDALSNQNPIVLIIETGERRIALAVDNLLGQREIVIKSTGTHLRYVKGISGVTIMGDGSVIPILNVEELLRTGTVAPEVILSENAPMAERSLYIMVVDDSVSIRQVVSRLMEKQGWQVETAKDGMDALEKLRDFRPDLIVLDIEMPRMNGYEFLNAIRLQPTYQNIPVVMLTSRTTSKHRDKAIALGAKGFIAKPYHDDEFVNLVMRLTEKRK